LPVVKGDRNTVTQIAVYAVITFAVSLIPFLMPQVGWIYAGTAVVLNVILLYLCGQLYRQTNRPRASKLFHYSMLYLAILFLMLAVDRAVVMKGDTTPANKREISVRLLPFQKTDRQNRQGFVILAVYNHILKRTTPIARM
jgi:hypothetical protein